MPEPATKEVSIECLGPELALTDEQPSTDSTAAIGGAADIGGLAVAAQDSRNDPKL